ncbi:IniB N-terminal domain-containing protein [Pseudonocardia adelaidensis]|uniref:Dentin sialophosphoprotein n=1 Tax=Pseudonocardia adelaidensis TaxID=648754 RepID=A0ABP9NLD1_9PSEU
MTLLEFLRSLIFDEDARQEFADNPEQALDDAGLGHLSADDVRDALEIMQDDSQDADFSRNYNGGDNEVNIAAPSPVEHHHDGGSESAAEYINKYIYNNYVTNEGDTITDNSINQQIDTGGGDFDQNIDIDSTVASGDGAVAAGDDIEDSQIATGDNNTIGDGNTDVDVEDGGSAVVGDDNQVVNGDGNTTGFGDGDVSSTDIDGDVSVDDGSSFAIGGDSSVDSRDQSDDDVNIDNSDNSVEDSGNTTTDWHDESDNSSHTSIEDNDEYSEYSDSSDHSSYNDNDSTETDSHDSVDSDYSIQA